MDIDKEMSILQKLKLLGGRITGKTTRLADSYIQELYNSQGKWIKIIDHYPSRNADRVLLNIIVRRMQFEHPSDVIDIDKKYNKIKLVSCQRDFADKRIHELLDELNEIKTTKT